ncbi:MAG: metal-dependent hydrolase [Helicobacteraceae bacterium]|jgi:cytosine/adenosine deaminase-related metal-dependent hydrolase|nr:metal-dependent hydrolase [Helicobacteraceae bacterium]
MKVITADLIFTMNEGGDIIRNGAIVIQEGKIARVLSDRAEISGVKENADEIVDCGENSVLTPGLINSHTHLEFSANAADLDYGTFIGWLSSVISKRENLMKSATEDIMESALDSSLKSGVTAIGAISSYGYDLAVLSSRREKVVFFNELIGSNPVAADAIWASFMDRVERSAEHQSERFRAGVAIHSPYSTHLVLARKAAELAALRGMPLTAHFMESEAERKWLDSGAGVFKPFFERFFNRDAPFCKAIEFLQAFGGAKVIWAHCVWASAEELDYIAGFGGAIAHCPVSNRLLGVGLLNLEAVKNREIDYMVATDGLSSNRSLNLFEELRSALLMHCGLDLNLLARDLLLSVTRTAAQRLQLNCGVIGEGYDADLITFKLPAIPESNEALALHTILHAPREMDAVFINGDQAL